MGKGDVGTGCYPVGPARLLPKTWFSCDNDVRAALLGTTTTTKPNTSCDKLTEDSCVAPDCLWCTSAAVGGGCYTPEEAKLLPSAIFKCKGAPSLAEQLAQQ